MPAYQHPLYGLKDSDTDGVINLRDQCPVTPKGSEVNNAGCPSWIDVVKYREAVIYFANTSAHIPSQQLPVLQKLAQQMRRNPDSRLNIRGYASIPGSAAYNLELSRQRAERVQRLLTNAFQVNPGQITIHWYGDSRPAISGLSRQANRLNRRVTLFLTYSVQQTVKKWSAEHFSGSAFQ